MAKKRLDIDDTLKSFMGKDNEGINQDEVNEVENQAVAKTAENVSKDNLIRITAYVTEKQRKALIMKKALSNKPEDKDFSSIVRTMIDTYLADILKDL